MLSLTKLYLNLPATDERATDAQIYQALTETQARVVQMLAFAHPESVLSAPTKLSTSDSGLTYTFGTDSGLPTNYTQISAEGHIRLLASKTGPEILPGTDADNTTDVFLFEDGVIRWPGGKTRTFSDGPYARFITPPGVIDASSGVPTLKPVHLRRILPFGACSLIATRLGEDPTPFEAQFQQAWKEELLALKSRFFGQGRAGMNNSAGPWWRSFRAG